ncbi:hypothetical protein FRC10_000356 [Ceratobasidium sp. 414]|nr:hypothetical protein FRC10_000356 [Ceratobasidium sp. 414]
MDGSRLPLVPGRNEHSQQSLAQNIAPPLELHPLPGLFTGTSSNRVDIVFFSDGYTAEEKVKFFDDATRLGIAITVNQTYAPVAPLLNFWGAFTPSVDSGIGVGGKPKEFVFAMIPYMEGWVESSRKVFYNCLILGTISLNHTAGSQQPQCSMVLSHELGHSIIWVGDEYDGSVYFGANAAGLTHNESISWAHWLSEPNRSNSNINDETIVPPRAERNAVPLLEYPWTILNTTKPWSTTFTSDGTFSYALLRFSLSAVPDAEALHITLDGETISWEAKRGVGLDRWFYDVWVFGRNVGLRNGSHELSFALQEGGRDGLAQLCSVEVIEYGNENEFNFAEGFVGAFPTYSPEQFEDPGPDPRQPSRLENNLIPSVTNRHVYRHASAEWQTVSYRPTNEGCLMRQVAKPDFCVVCTEALWLKLLARVNLIDGVSISSSCSSGRDEAHVAIDVGLVPLAHLRSPVGAAYIWRKGVKEVYHVRWFSDGRELKAWRNLTRVDVDCGTKAKYEVEVVFESSEIRKDEGGHTVDRTEVWVGV